MTPSDPGPKHDTSYLAVVGPHTAFPGEKAVQLPRGDSNTILVVETTQSGIHWMEPRDMLIKDALQGINAKPGPSISSRHFENGGGPKPGAHVVMADGSVRWLTNDTDPKILRQMLEIQEEKSKQDK